MNMPIRLISFSSYWIILILRRFYLLPWCWREYHDLVVSTSSQSAVEAASGQKIEIRADSFGVPISKDEISGLYEKPSVFMQQNDSIEFNVLIEEDGFYTLAFDMAASESIHQWTLKDSALIAGPIQPCTGSIFQFL
jgi:hypothetical protein